MSQELDALRALLRDDIEKRVLLTVHQQVKKRIFDDGQDANSKQIGVYSNKYVRQRIKKGLTGSTKVVLEFTGQMKNDFQLLEDQGQYASGYLNNINGDKSNWVEGTYKTTIFDLTDQEAALMDELFEKEIETLINA
jgi:hypothetical protein